MLNVPTEWVALIIIKQIDIFLGAATDYNYILEVYRDLQLQSYMKVSRKKDILLIVCNISRVWLSIHFTFRFSHLADAFIQSDVLRVYKNINHS